MTWRRLGAECSNSRIDSGNQTMTLPWQTSRSGSETSVSGRACYGQSPGVVPSSLHFVFPRKKRLRCGTAPVRPGSNLVDSDVDGLETEIRRKDPPVRAGCDR